MKTEFKSVSARIQQSRLAMDNGSEFISKALDKWAYENNVVLDFSRPGKPTDNAYIDRVAGATIQWQLSGHRGADECLSIHWFLSLEYAQEKIEQWRQEYNRSGGPHISASQLAA